MAIGFSMAIGWGSPTKLLLMKNLCRRPVGFIMITPGMNWRGIIIVFRGLLLDDWELRWPSATIFSDGRTADMFWSRGR